MEKKKIQIIIPCHNEEENINLIFDRITNVIKKINKKYEVGLIFVNDGSRDNTTDKIKELAKINKNVAYIDFSRNFGHHAAIDAGIMFSKCDALIMIDADLQQPPEMILQFIDKWEEGFDIVNTKRLDGISVGIFKKLTANLFYDFINKFSSIHIEHGSADFRLIDGKVVEILKNLPEKEKFYRGLVNWVGYKTCTLEYKVDKRINGQSSYSLKKMLHLAKIGILSFSMLPIKLIIVMGSILSVIGLALFSIFTTLYFFDIKIFSGAVLLGFFIIMNTGIILLSLGINSIYLYTMFKQVENRPSYIIRESNIQ